MNWIFVSHTVQCKVHGRDMPQKLIAALSPYRTRFNPRPFVRILVDELALRKVFIRVLQLWPVSVSPPALRTHLHLHAALIRTANERSLRNFRKQVFLRKNGNHWTIKLHSLIFKIKHILSCVLRKAYRRLRHLQPVLHKSSVTYINLGWSIYKSLLRSILRTSQQICSTDSCHKAIKISE